MSKLLLYGGLASLGYVAYRVYSGYQHVLNPGAGVVAVTADPSKALELTLTAEKDFFWLPAGLLLAYKLL